MSLREVRLCDLDDVDYAGRPCMKLYKATCPVCERDCCEKHLAGGSIYVSTGVPTTSRHALALQLCKGCVETLAKANPIRLLEALNTLLQPLGPALLELVRAHLTTVIADKK